MAMIYCNSGGYYCADYREVRTLNYFAHACQDESIFRTPVLFLEWHAV